MDKFDIRPLMHKGVSKLSTMIDEGKADRGMMIFTIDQKGSISFMDVSSISAQDKINILNRIKKDLVVQARAKKGESKNVQAATAET